MKFSRLLSMLLVSALSAAGCTDASEETGDPQGTESALSNCNAKPLEVIVKGRENRFGLDGQQVALNPAIPIDRICQRVNAQCHSSCVDAEAKAVATGVRGFQDSDPVKLRQMGQLADAFNAALGITTNFSALGADQTATSEQTDAGVSIQDAAATPVVCNAKLLQVIVKGREHRFGFDDRQVALNPAIPTQNICQAVTGDCQALCNDARDAAIATGVVGFSGGDDAQKQKLMGQLADHFNAALGSASAFEANPIIQN